MKFGLIYDAATVLAGQASAPHLVIAGGVVALTWIAMDVVQFADWLAGKLASGELPFPT
jgi:hypothetical protein